MKAQPTKEIILQSKKCVSWLRKMPETPAREAALKGLDKAIAELEEILGRTV